MIINDNLAALNAFNELTKNTTAMNSALAELSSGKQINTAADNPAGFTISESIQGQISGLNQANVNVQDTNSMLQTAMAGMTQSQNIMETMRQLAVQAANGTNTSTDAAAIQAQINQFTSEVTQIAQTTQYNSMNLLMGGTPTGTTNGLVTTTHGQTAVQAVSTITVNNVLITGEVFTVTGLSGSVNLSGGMFAGQTTLLAASNIASQVNTIAGLSATVAGNVVTITTSLADAGSAITLVATGTYLSVAPSTLGATGIAGVYTFTGTTNFAGNDEVNINGQIFTAVSSGATANQFLVGANLTATLTNLAAAVNADSSLGYSAASAGTLFTLTQRTPNTNAPVVTIGAAFTTDLQIGANQGQLISLSMNDMRASALGLAGSTNAMGANGDVTGAVFTNGVGNNLLSSYTTFGEGALNVTTVTGATAAISVIDEAINAVSYENSMLGATVDRLNTSGNELTSASQQLTAANAGLVDVDMASAMTAYTQNAVLVQSATSMLAQAQQEPQSVLKLLS
jgi:flagellin